MIDTAAAALDQAINSNHSNTLCEDPHGRIATAVHFGIAGALNVAVVRLSVLVVFGFVVPAPALVAVLQPVVGVLSAKFSAVLHVHGEHNRTTCMYMRVYICDKRGEGGIRRRACNTYQRLYNISRFFM